MYECSSEYETVFLKNNTEPKPGICADGTNPEWRLPSKLCNKISFGWAVGGDLVRINRIYAKMILHLIRLWSMSFVFKLIFSGKIQFPWTRL